MRRFQLSLLRTAGGRSWFQAEYDAAAAARANAYRLESDPLKTEAEFDAIKAGVEPDYSAWIAKVEEIKARFPLPGPLPE
ncbi:hypothetical protein AAA528_00840 [Pseudomonas aeruginosa]